MFKTYVDWKKESEVIKKEIESFRGCTRSEANKYMISLAKKYGVSRQRMYQVFKQYGIKTLMKTRHSYFSFNDEREYWLYKMINHKTNGLTIEEKEEIYKSLLPLPEFCPVLNIPLSYYTYSKGETKPRGDSSASIDRLDSSQGYVLGNVAIISWRANRIKNDSTAEELRLIADWLEDKIKIT